MGDRPRCPKCAGRLFVDQAAAGLGQGTAELACLSCGWRQLRTLAQLGISPPTTTHQPRLHIARKRR